VGNKKRFSDHFGLKKSQAQLDFVDIPVETDIPLFVDPYAMHISSQDWLRDCGNAVVEYFQTLIDEIRKGNERVAMQLLDNFHEPNETHLGISSGRPAGRGWGSTQAHQLYSVLRSSEVVKTGDFSDLGDYEMFIPGIGPDKISDLATNIIKSELLSYTEEQCALFHIPVEKVNSGRYWDRGRRSFVSRYVYAPIYAEKTIMLVPKLAVRVRLVPDHDKFYSRFVLDYLEAELIDANDSLVTVLKNGNKKVMRGDLRQRFQFSREDLYNFSQRHPDVLRKYKETLPGKAKPISDQEIEWRQKYPREVELGDLGTELDAIKPGPSEAGSYHNAILGLLSAIYYPSLTRPVKEAEIDEGRKRIDIRFDNAADSGFFSKLVNQHKVFAPYVMVECKNYSEDPSNPELDQLRGRLGRKRGNFGLLVCRKVDDSELMLKRCKDIVNGSDQVIIVLEDGDIREMLRLKKLKGDEGVSDYMQGKLDQVLM
jgi:hypothetical protein